ncbi:MAG: SocA family protein [Alphaproteobacteria bacterium]|nr:SocA family protein [Alphaproteobacteria bacterium]
MDFDRDKFKLLVHYVVWKTSDVEGFGATKLNKVLWFADARSYEVWGRSITGETYIRQQFGPVPEHITEAMGELVNEGPVQAWSQPFYDRQLIRYSTDEAPDTSAFTVDELGLIDWWIKHVAEDHSAVSISEKSHDFGWRISLRGESLPYKAFLAKRIRSPREGDELNWARRMAEEINSEE